MRKCKFYDVVTVQVSARIFNLLKSILAKMIKIQFILRRWKFQSLDGSEQFQWSLCLVFADNFPSNALKRENNAKPKSRVSSDRKNLFISMQITRKQQSEKHFPKLGTSNTSPLNGRGKNLFRWECLSAIEQLLQKTVIMS